MRYVILFAICWCTSAVQGQQWSLEKSLVAMNAVGNGGEGHDVAIKAWKVVGDAKADSLPEILKAIDDGKPLAANWIRAAVDQIAERSLREGRPLPAKELENIVFDAGYSPRARRLAYEWLSKVDDGAEDRIIPRMLNDSSLEMRRDAVAKVLDQAVAAKDSKPAATALYKEALTAARDKDQIDAAFDALKELGVEVDLPSHFGFITNWKLIGPFDNTAKAGFDVAYPPEGELKFDAEYPGKTGSVKWFDHQTSDRYGMVNINEAVGKNMGAAAYAFNLFESSSDRDVELRLGCVCANKVWLNGELVMANEVYHSGSSLDQYVASGKLKRGRNVILLKICQNEQTENWAQDWEFQLRICDAVGTAVLAANRPEPDK